MSRAAMVRREFYQRAGGFLCIAQGNLEDFVGDAIVTSTNCRLEGTHRRNWWGFIGRKSADAALHEKAGPQLLQACREKAAELPFGTVLVTPAGPKLAARYVLHTAVPSHPAGRDPRPLPAAQAADFATAEAAVQVLREGYAEVLRQAAGVRAETLACPAVGCGIRGYPIDEAARIGLEAIAHNSAVPYVEVRIWDRMTFETWRQECSKMGLTPCTEDMVESSLWDGEPLASWQAKRIARDRSLCQVM
mmetsp:Transcript_33159/g.104998  ORF Transcript_33159/g.104998 Transcript_33159/m.104998 type:complete len:248 (+) Transcript_33159:38-781(+)